MQIRGRRGGGRNINTGGDEISHCVTWYILMSLFEEEEDHEDMRVVKKHVRAVTVVPQYDLELKSWGG